MVEDVTYLNYLALAGAILLDPNSEDYKQIVYNKELYDKDEEIKRIKGCQNTGSLFLAYFHLM